MKKIIIIAAVATIAIADTYTCKLTKFVNEKDKTSITVTDSKPTIFAVDNKGMMFGFRTAEGTKAVPLKYEENGKGDNAHISLYRGRNSVVGLVDNEFKGGVTIMLPDATLVYTQCIKIKI